MIMLTDSECAAAKRAIEEMVRRGMTYDEAKERV